MKYWAILFFLVIAANGNALLLSQDDEQYGSDSITYDTNSGLEWLDLTQSLNLTFNEVSGMFGSGQQYEGFRYATIYEVEELWYEAGVETIGDGYYVENYDAVLLLIDLMGETASRGVDSEFPTVGNIGLTAFNEDYAYRSILNLPPNPLYTGIAQARLDTIFTETDFIVPERIGHYLVRETEAYIAPSIPDPKKVTDPDTAIIFLISLLILTFTYKQKHEGRSISASDW